MIEVIRLTIIHNNNRYRSLNCPQKHLQELQLHHCTVAPLHYTKPQPDTSNGNLASVLLLKAKRGGISISDEVMPKCMLVYFAVEFVANFAAYYIR